MRAERAAREAGTRIRVDAYAPLAHDLGVRIHHVALRVADCSRAADFYTGLLGLPELRRFAAEGGPRAVWVRAGDGVIMLERALKGTGVETGSGHVLVFAVNDLSAWEVRLQEAGIPVDDRTAYTLYVRDPDGHRVGLSVYRFDTAGA